MRIDTYIKRESNKGHATVEIKMQKNYPSDALYLDALRTCSFLFLPFQQITELGDTVY